MGDNFENGIPKDVKVKIFKLWWDPEEERVRYDEDEDSKNKEKMANFE